MSKTLPYYANDTVYRIKKTVLIGDEIWKPEIISQTPKRLELMLRYKSDNRFIRAIHVIISNNFWTREIFIQAQAHYTTNIYNMYPLPTTLLGDTTALIGTCKYITNFQGVIHE